MAHLHGDPTAKPRILSLIDVSHPALTEETLYRQGPSCSPAVTLASGSERDAPSSCISHMIHTRSRCSVTWRAHQCASSRE